jgi:uncharacterized surface protein with fasciclin (FAS1) repeats
MRLLALATLALLAGCVQPAERAPVSPPVRPVTASNPLVGGVAIPADRTIADTVAAVPTLSTLNRAVQAFGLAPTLNAPTPLTLFAPTDQAFGRLAPGTLDALLKPDNRASLGKLLNLHLIPGRVSSAELARRIAAGGGRATLTTLGGETLTLSMTGAVVTLTDAGGNKSYLETADISQANGVIHVVNGVLVPRIE